MGLGNQQERSTELAFVAGLIVGEGCFSICVRSPVRTTRWSIIPIFSMSMRDHATMHYVAEILRDHGLPFHMSLKKNGTLEITAHGIKRTKRYTDTFIPYLTGHKKACARVVAEYIDSRLSKSYKSPPSSEEIGLIEQLRSMNGLPGKRVNSLDFLRDLTPGAA